MIYFVKKKNVLLKGLYKCEWSVFVLFKMVEMLNFLDYCDRNFIYIILNFIVFFGFYIGFGVFGNFVVFIFLFK